MPTLFCDFETRSTVDLRKAGADVYARHASTQIMCMGYAFDDEPVNLWKFGEELHPRVKDHVILSAPIVAHNAAFELVLWNETATPKYDWPLFDPSQAVCTMAMAYAMALPGSLEKAAAAVGIENQKDLAGGRVTLQLAQPRDVLADGTVTWFTEDEFPEKFEKMYAYCKQDVIVMRDLYKRLVHLSQSEKETWLLDHRINQRGIRIDIALVKKAIELVKLEQARLNSEMQKVTGGVVSMCTAVGQLTDWINWQGVKTDGVAKSDVVDLLENDSLPSQVRTALLLRQEAAKSSTAKLEAMLRGTCDDGRARGLFQYHVASTGRWAGRRIQLQNLPRPKISQADIDQVFSLLERAS